MPNTDNTASASASSGGQQVDSIASNRKFGVEVEFIGLSCRSAATTLASVSGLDVNHNSTGDYNHRNSNTHWKIVTDASVSGAGGCGEAVSPILSGLSGLANARKAVAALSDAGAKVNKSCGLHVHVDARDLTAADIANVMRRYAKFEAQLDAIMPVSRRHNNARFCRSIVGDVEHADITGRLTRAINSNSPRDIVERFGDRFRKVNVQSYHRHGTIEFRHHSGSCNPEKVAMWIKFCVNFVEASRVSMLNEEVASSSSSSSSSSGRRARTSKTLIALHKIVNNLQGAGWTGTKIALLGQLTGLSEASVVVYISNLRTQYGFTIKKNSYSDSYRLVRNGVLPPLGDPAPVASSSASAFSSSDGVAVAIAIAAANDSPWRGLPVSVVSYYNERAQDFAEV